MDNHFEPKEFFLELPLYLGLDFDRDDVFSITNLLYFSGTIDTFCLKCKRESTFHGTNDSIPDSLKLEAFEREKRKHSAAVIPPGNGIVSHAPSPPLIPQDIYLTSFCCGRNKDHTLQFIYKVQNRLGTDDEGKKEVKQCVEKIGQYPSLADLHLPNIQKYRSILSKDEYTDLSRGIGLAAHDVGIGAFVYLRRVFERLVERAHVLAKSTDGWDEEAYQNMRMTECVKALQHYLPSFLVEHPEMYSLLSKGIHELSEDLCLKNFPALRVGIELILDEKIVNAERERKLMEASKAIRAAASSIESDEQQ